MLILKIQDNLHVTEKGDIWSYYTHVGKIEKDRIKDFVWYSRTTTKHMTRISRLTGLILHYHKSKSKKGTGFYKLAMGVNPVSPFPKENCLSEKTSKILIKGIASGDLVKAIVENASEIKSKNDLTNLKGYLKRKGISSEVFAALVDVSKALTLAGA
jgi:hypothetical protein